MALLYVVMEYAEEDLAQIIPQRPLTPAETGDALRSVLDSLSYIHSQKLVHGHLKPSNIMAIGDQLKLSTDTCGPAGEAGRLTRSRDNDLYDPPEAASGAVSPASDLWSLGVTLVDMLTQASPVWNGAQEPVLPSAVPEPFRTIATRCLRQNPEQRCSTAQAAAYLRAGAAAPKPEVAKPAPVEAPRTPPINEPRIPPARVAQRSSTKSGFSLALWQRPYLVPLAVGGLALILWGGSRLFTSQPKVQEVQIQSASPKPAELPAAAPEETTRKPLPGEASHRRRERSRKPVEIPTSVVRQERTAGAVVHRVLPNVSQSALNTIQGHVRVSVRVGVDASGNVVSASLESSGPSKYFASRALDAARSWKFSPTDSSAPRQWLIQFAFSRGGTDVSPSQVR
jgi:TonB family protein